MPFSRLFLLSPWLQTRQVHDELSYCICKLPVAPPTNLVGLEAPGVGPIDDLWVVIHDAQGSKVACPVHFGVMPSEGIGAPVGLHLFQNEPSRLKKSGPLFFSNLPSDPTQLMIWTSTTVSSCSRACRLASGILFPFSRVLCQPSTTHGFSSSFFKELEALGSFPFFNQPLQVDIQSLPEGILLCHLLSGSEASPAHIPAPGPILPSGRMGLQGLLNLFQGFPLLMLFFKSFSFLPLHRSQCLFQGFFLLLRRSWGGSRVVCHGQGGPLQNFPGLPPGLGSSATHGLPSLAVHFFKWTFVLLGRHHFSSGPPQAGWFFQTWREFFQTLCGLVVFKLEKSFFQNLCGHSYNYKRQSAVGGSAVTMLWLEYVVAICYHLYICPTIHACAVQLRRCVCVCIYCPTIHVLCCCVSVHVCVCVQWHGHAWAKLAAGHNQVTNQQKHRQNLQLSGVTHLGGKPHPPLVGPIFSTNLIYPKLCAYLGSYVHAEVPFFKGAMCMQRYPFSRELPGSIPFSKFLCLWLPFFKSAENTNFLLSGWPLAWWCAPSPVSLWSCRWSTYIGGSSSLSPLQSRICLDLWNTCQSNNTFQVSCQWSYFFPMLSLCGFNLFQGFILSNLFQGWFFRLFLFQGGLFGRWLFEDTHGIFQTTMHFCRSLWLKVASLFLPQPWWACPFLWAGQNLGEAIKVQRGITHSGL